MRLNSFASEEIEYEIVLKNANGEELAEMGYLNRKGEPYSQTSMAKFLTNPRYKGFYTANLTKIESYKTHKKIKVPECDQIIYKSDLIDAIIPEKLWDKANSLYKKKYHKKNNGKLIKT